MTQKKGNLKWVTLSVILVCGMILQVGTLVNYVDQTHSVQQTDTPPQGEPFLPAYLKMLKGERPFPTEEPSCTAHTIEELLLPAPCDG